MFNGLALDARFDAYFGGINLYRFNAYAVHAPDPWENVEYVIGMCYARSESIEKKNAVAKQIDRNIWLIAGSFERTW